MALIERIGGKAAGLIALRSLGVHIPPTLIVEQPPLRFPIVSEPALFVRQSESTADIADEYAAQKESGASGSKIVTAQEWTGFASGYRNAAPLVIQPYIVPKVAMYGHTDTELRQSYVSAGASLSALAGGMGPDFEAVFDHRTRKVVSHSRVVPGHILRSVTSIFDQLVRVDRWPWSAIVEWEAAVLEPMGVIFLQCQASTATLPEWSRS